MKALLTVLAVLVCTSIGAAGAQAQDAAQADSLFMSRAEVTIQSAVPREHSRWINGDEYQVSYQVQYLGIVGTFQDRYGTWETLDTSGKQLWKELLDTAKQNGSELYIMGLATERPFAGFAKADGALLNNTLSSLRATTLMLWANDNYPEVRIHKLTIGDYEAPTRGAAVWQVKEIVKRSPLKEFVIAAVEPVLDKRDDDLRKEWKRDIANATTNLNVTVDSPFWGAIGVGYSGLWAEKLNFSGLALEGMLGYKRVYLWGSGGTWLDQGGNPADVLGKAGFSYALTRHFHLGVHYAYAEEQLPADMQYISRGHFDEVHALGVHARYGTPIVSDSGWKLQVRAGLNRAYWETRSSNGNDLGFNLEAGVSFAFN